MKTVFQIMSVLGVVLLGLASCEDANSTPAGRYIGELVGTGIEVELNFGEDGAAVMTMVESGNRLDDMECSYESGESRTVVKCFGSSGISLKTLENGDLEGDMNGMIVHFKKQ